MSSEKKYHILVINPGSTSTKLSYYENEACLFETDVFHDSSVLLKFSSINDQLDYRMEVIHAFLKKNGIDLSGLDAVVGRGGGCAPVKSGVYRISEKLIEDTRQCRGGLYHSSMLGVQMAQRIHDKYGGDMFMVDPPVVDELQDEARITGVSGVYRRAVSHALNLKEAARRYAASIGREYEDCRLIVCHIDGGISITAHDHGRMIDGNNAGGGEGPFTPTRMGSMAVTDLLAHQQDWSAEDLKEMCSQAGGLSSWFHTSSSDEIHKLVDQGDPQAVRVWNAMIYQTAKWIGAMSTVLQGRVDGIVLTGGLLRFPDVLRQIEDRCGWIAPVKAYPGEFEQEAMASNALKALRHQLTPMEYTGDPVWDGFKD